MKYIRPIPLYAWYVYKYEDGREIKLDQQFGLAPVRKKYLNRTKEISYIDGNLKDWPGLPYHGGYESVISQGKQEYQGDYDAHFDFNVTYDDENLYLAMTVWDDHLELNRKKSFFSQDAVLINIDPRPVLISANDRTDNRYINQYFHLSFSPSLAKNQAPFINQEESLPEGTRLVTRKSIEGFDLELSIPLQYIRSLGGSKWETIRLNIAYLDCDNNDSRSHIWWKPNWSSKSNYIGSGMFFRTEPE